MIELMSAIALLCTTPTYARLSQEEVLQCQKYYLDCAVLNHKGDWSQVNSTVVLAKCVKKKQKLGGPK